MIQSAKTSSGWFAGTVSVVLLLVTASGVFAELQDSMNTIWEVQPKPGMGWMDTIRKRFFSMAMVLGVGFLLIVSLFVSTLLGTVVTRIAGDGAIVGFILDAVLTLFIGTLFFCAVFKLLPDVEIRWRDVMPGAILTAVTFTVGKYLLTWYLSRGTTTSAYGAAGSLAALLIWVYYSAWMMFFGAEFTQAYVKAYGSHTRPDPDAIPVTKEQRAQQGLVSEEDRHETEDASNALAAQRGAPYRRRSAVPSRRVVTITKPTAGSNRAYAVAGAGLAAGFVVGALGMLTGRRYQRGGINQISLDHRLADLEKRLGDTPLTVAATAARIQAHLNTLDARLDAAQQATKKRVHNAAAPAGSVRERFNAAVEREERKHHPTLRDRLTGNRRQPTWFERLNELVS
jgi:membrane protein